MIMSFLLYINLPTCTHTVFFMASIYISYDNSESLLGSLSLLHSKPYGYQLDPDDLPALWASSSSLCVCMCVFYGFYLLRLYH